jgi:hypothetical protein
MPKYKNKCKNNYMVNPVHNSVICVLQIMATVDDKNKT